MGSGQTINDVGGQLKIDAPDRFAASINWTPLNYNGNAVGISLAGLVADHASYQNDLLSLTLAGKDVFDLHLHVADGYTISAEQNSGSVFLYSAKDLNSVGDTPIPISTGAHV